MRTLFKNESGVGAIEFALTAPFLALVLLGIMSGWSYFQQDGNMRDSVEAATKYYIQGGTSDDTAQSIADAAWRLRPSGGQVSISRSCICATAVVSCIGGVVCIDLSVPEIHLAIVATSSWTDPYSTSIFPTGLNLRESENIRVR